LQEKKQSSVYDGQARVTRSGTLDGGTVIDHMGFADGDRKPIRAKVSLSESDEAILKSMFENETLIHVATRGGFYSGAISSLKGDGGEIEISILIKEKV
jgi:hypothetical protein